MNDLVSFDKHGLMLPSDWGEAGRVYCIPGSLSSGYEGWGGLVLTPDVLALITPNGVEEAAPLWGIEDVSVIKFDGVLLQRQTSVGPMLSPLPYPHGIEVVYSTEIRLRLRLRVATLVGNVAQAWCNDIRRAVKIAQLGDLEDLHPIKRSSQRK